MDTVRKTAEGTMTAEIDDPWLSVPKAARVLDVATATVRSLALNGKLRIQIVDGRQFVHRDSIDEYLASKREAE